MFEADYDLKILFFVFLLAPFLTFIHELGHAFLPVLKGEVVSIRVGEKPVIMLELKNLNISIGLLKP